MRKWNRKRAQHDFSDEVRAHIEIEAEELVRAGMPAREARAAARRAFGSVAAAEERFYESARVMWMERLRQDVRYALRTLRLAPAHTAAALATFALGIGVTAAVFSLVYALGVRPLPVRDAARVVTVYQEFRGDYDRRVEGSRFLFSLPEYVEYRDHARASLDGLAAYAEAELAVGSSRAPAGAQLVSCNYFDVLRVRLAAGRGLAPDECERPGAGAVAVLAHDFWRRELGADPSVVGRTIRVGAHVVTVVGVAERGFGGTEVQAADLWLPLAMQPVLRPGSADPADRDVSWLSVVGRLRPGATRDGAYAELATIAHRLDADRPGRRTLLHVGTGTFANQPEVRHVGSYAAMAAAGAAALVLLMACVNVMSLSLSRAVARRREIGVRLALGAGRGRLVRQLLTESVLLALAGGALGLAVAWWLPRTLVAAVPARGVRVDLTPDAHVAAFAFLVSLAAAVASGRAPALQATRRDGVAALKGDRGGGGRRAGAARLRGRLVGVQLAGSLLLLVLGGLLARGVRRAQTMDPGFAVEGVLSLSLDLGGGYTAPRAAALYAALAERLRAHPGVRSVALAQSLPLVARGSGFIRPDRGAAAEAPDAGGGVPIAFAVVSGSYFATMGVPIVRGRAFADAELPGAALAGAAGARPAVVSAALARRVWGAAEPLGARFQDGERAFYVVGVAGDVHNVSLAETDPAFVSMPAAPDEAMGMRLLVRERDAIGGGEPVAAAVPALVAALDPGVAVSVERFADRLARKLEPARAAATACAVVGMLAAALALVGVYGVATYKAGGRAREVAVRIALGASARDVLAVMMRDGTRAVVAGLVVGTLLAAAAARLLRGALFGLGALDPVAFLGAAALLGGAALAAMYRPARRAARTEPAAALRDE